eukprot:TRINITY_DN2438_c0_g1_i1.p2 TRINITY_DN2438_c0_g1~~TRINITY_DN2438_c0_g1_i1.p2  ORF type:complete len:279 (-),score=-5.83 TRINITY_DN2438_c0_g1_i1:201-1037(-)
MSYDNVIMDVAEEIRPDEEMYLWQDYRSKNPSESSHIRLVEIYLPLVIKIARRMPIAVRNKISVDELVGIGVLGLHKALDSFSNDRNTMFSTYAYKRIKGAMLDELRRMDALTRTQRNRYRDICEAINRWTRDNARPPTEEELAEELSISVYEVERYIGMGSETINLNEEFQEGINYLDVIPDENASSPDHVTHQIMAIEQLREHFYTLSEREQKILYLRHFEEMSVKEVAQIMEISEGRISQIYQKILLKLRSLMEVQIICVSVRQSIQQLLEMYTF